MAEMDEEIKKELTSLASMAKRLGLKGSQATKYVQEHMEKLGYVAHTTVSYSRRENTNKGGGFLGGLFGGGGSDDGDDDDL